MAQNLTNQQAEVLTNKLTKRIEEFSNTMSASISNLTESIEFAGRETSKANTKIFWLNIVLSIATAVGAIATALLAFDALRN